MSHTHKFDASVIPLRRKTQVIEAVNDELWVSEVDDLALGELGAKQVHVIGADGR
jgi:hypothetical protein